MANIVAKLLEIILAIGSGAAGIHCVVEFYQPTVPQELKR